MRVFGSLRIAAAIAILFLSLAASMPSKKVDDYLLDGEPEDDAEGDPELDDDPPAKPSGPVVVRSHSVTVEKRPGETVELPCLVDNGGDLIINWMKGKEMIFTDSDQVNVEDTRFTRADNYSLIIRNVTEKDASDSWHCQILTQPEPTEIYHKLRINEKPRELSTEIHVTPDRYVERNESATVTLGCETNSQPKREIKWSYKGERLHNNNDYKIEGNFLTIRKLGAHHAGRYQCLVEDNSDNPPTDSIEVVVRYAPQIHVERQVVHTGTGRRSKLTCIVHAHPHAKVMWQKGNQKISTNDGGRFSTVENKSQHKLVIEDTKQEDLGEYICHAKNKYGESSKMIMLTGAPSQPKLHGGEVSDDEPTFILKWQVESFAPIDEYKLEYRQKDEKDWKIVAPRVNNGVGNQFIVEYPLEKLQPGSYEARIKARNDFGWSQYSDIHTFREGYKSERAENVQGSTAATCQPILAFTALLAVAVTSYKSSSL